MAAVWESHIIKTLRSVPDTFQLKCNAVKCSCLAGAS